MRPGVSMALISVFCLFAVAFSVQAGDNGRQSPFSIGAGGRSSGLGGAYTALSANAGAIYFNPAGLGRLEFQEASFNHTLLIENSAYTYGSWVYPVSNRQGFGVGFMRIGTGDIQRTSGFVRSGTFGFSQSQLVISYGYSPTDRFSVGGSVKLVNASLDGFSDHDAGLDLGARVELLDGLTLGFVARDLIGAELRLKDFSEEATQVYTTGLAYEGLSIGKNISATASIDIEKADGSDAKFHGGVEVAFDSTYALRAGYDRDNFSFGAGLRRGRISFDYAYKIIDFLEDNHNFAVSFLIGSRAAPPMTSRSSYDSLNQFVDPATLRFNELETIAKEYFYQFKLDSAIFYYQEALAIDSGNEQIIGSIAALEQARSVMLEQARLLEQVRIERIETIETYYKQARKFYAEKLYTAANDIISLILDIEPSHEQSRRLRLSIADDIRKEIVYNQGLAKGAMSRGRVAEAIEAYNRILELDSTNVLVRSAKEEALAHLNLAQQISIAIELFDKGQLQEADIQFRAILKFNPNDSTVRDYLRRIRQAKVSITTLEELQKDKTAWQLYLDGMRFMRDRQYQKAISAWQKVLEKYPNSPDTKQNMAQARLRLKSE